MAIIASYLIDSFKNPLPWTECKPEWENCFASGGERLINESVVVVGQTLHRFGEGTNASQLMSSAEYYFV